MKLGNNCEAVVTITETNCGMIFFTMIFSVGVPKVRLARLYSKSR